MLIGFDNGLTLYSHNQLYGLWKVVPAGQRPETSRSLRVKLETARKAILLYSASDVSIWPSDKIHRHPFLAGLGPDVLDPALEVGQVEERLRDARFRRRSLAALLLDQAFLAGMGNYLRSEVLFEARLAPGRRPVELDQDEIGRLAAALLAVPRRSYLTRGIAAARGMRRDYLADGESFRFRVFGRADQPCQACGTPVRREERAGRRLYRCPACQPEPWTLSPRSGGSSRQSRRSSR
ncbi:MAG: endonuclease VIII [Chromatiales bacterium]|nr:endonuclease VIII [Chromatiales bacterium]